MSRSSAVFGLPHAVLVVDDEDVVRKVCTMALEQRGLPVIHAARAEDALVQLQANAFGCALLDKNLPGQDGIELLKHIRQQQPFCACIMMTAFASVDSAIQALRLGATDYLTKPFASTELIAEKVELAIKHAQSSYERDTFAKKIREFEAELGQQRETVDAQKTEIALFNDILEYRLHLATEDLQNRCKALEKRLNDDENAQLFPAIAEHVTELRALAKRSIEQLSDRFPAAEARGVLFRILRQLTALEDLLGSRRSR